MTYQHADFLQELHNSTLGENTTHHILDLGGAFVLVLDMSPDPTPAYGIFVSEPHAYAVDRKNGILLSKPIFENQDRLNPTTFSPEELAREAEELRFKSAPKTRVPLNPENERENIETLVRYTSLRRGVTARPTVPPSERFWITSDLPETAELPTPAIIDALLICWMRAENFHHMDRHPVGALSKLYINGILTDARTSRHFDSDTTPASIIAPLLEELGNTVAAEISATLRTLVLKKQHPLPEQSRTSHDQSSDPTPVDIP